MSKPDVLWLAKHVKVLFFNMDGVEIRFQNFSNTILKCDHLIQKFKLLKSNIQL